MVYTGKTKKIAEHGGASAADRHVPLVVSGAVVPHGLVLGVPVPTTAIAPAILVLLGLDPRDLDAVRSGSSAPSLVRT